MEAYSNSQISSTSIFKQEQPHTTHLSVKQMFKVIDENSNLEWESFTYKVPKHYHSVKNIKKTLPQKDSRKSSYLDEVETLGKMNPGVGKYDVDVKHRKSFSKWDGKCPKRQTIFVEAYEKNKKTPTPGPASYFAKKARTQNTIEKIRNKSTVDRTSYLNEIQYLGVSSPGIGQYNIATNILKPSNRSSKATRPSTAKPAKTPKMSQINPIIDGTFSKATFMNKIRPQTGLKKSTFPRDKRFQVNKDHEAIPAANKYKHQQCTNSTLIRNRSIYY